MPSKIVDIVRQALEEDIGTGDITSQACIPENRQAAGHFLARETVVLAGTELVPIIYEMRGGVTLLEILHKDGDHLLEGDRIANVTGRARTLLECERVALNFLQRLSGVATLANQFSALVKERIAEYSTPARLRQA